MANNESGSLRARVFAALEKAIINGEYKSGDNLSELMLSQKYGVSRTPVREALMQLELEGLVENIPNKGAVVVGISDKDIDDIYIVRMRIEGLAARLCAANIEESELKALEKITGLQEFYLERGDYDSLRELDSEFHSIIFDSCGNRALRFMLSNFHNYTQRARTISVKSIGRAEKTVSEHRAILEALRKRDGDLAEQLTTEHIEHAKESIRANT
ncbi:MAG: GntR family transcriptional regulator [Clostridia bacterium]|nr:GntR family transcriptional regulator [Clostridia bacterium]